MLGVGAVDEAVLVRVPRRLGAVFHVELAIDVREVELDGLLRDPELFADRLVRKAAGKRLEDGRLAFCETGRFDGILLGCLLGQPDCAEDGSFEGLA